MLGSSRSSSEVPYQVLESLRSSSGSSGPSAEKFHGPVLGSSRSVPADQIPVLESFMIVLRTHSILQVDRHQLR